jgi:hypothetical protein
MPFELGHSPVIDIERLAYRAAHAAPLKSAGRQGGQSP